MRLSGLTAGVPHFLRGPASDPEITGVTHDSRRAGPGFLFAAFPGLVHDGRVFVAEAVERGAVAVLGAAPAPAPLTVPYLEVEGPREAAGILAARLAGSPAERLVLAGVTGTSGKTTTTVLLDAVLGAALGPSGLFGTLVYRGAGGERKELEASRTTPEATDLQPMLAALLAEGGRAAALECSSHALALSRLAGCRFDVAVFTNLSHDHLDFHATMEKYFETKALLFSMLKEEGRAVVNLDDPWGRRLFDRLDTEWRLGYSLEGRAGARLVAEAALTTTGTRLALSDRETGRRWDLTSALLGRPNAENLLSASAAAAALGIDPRVAARAFASVECVPGRLEPVPNPLGLTVLVDYAHKPAALDGVLRTARSLASGKGGRVVVLFGCGGDRDRGKRPEMGGIAARLADFTILTSDNPRSEEPGAILAEIRAGSLAAGGAPLVVADRREAIGEALRVARAGDVVVLAGKGHETYQEAKGGKIPFDDRVVAAETIASLAGAAG